MDELALSLGSEGKMTIESIACTAARDVSVDIIEKRIWGLRYKDILLKETLVREPDQRGYDIRSTTPHVEESIYFFEKVLESMVGLAAYENKLKRLGDEITRISRKVKVLQERVLPRLQGQIRIIAQYISEREREVYYRLKKFKEITLKKQGSIVTTLCPIPATLHPSSGAGLRRNKREKRIFPKQCTIE